MCQEFAVPNCVESATFDPAKSLTEASKSITHHFQVTTERDAMHDHTSPRGMEGLMLPEGPKEKNQQIQ